MYLPDTIVAPATAPGRGAVAIVRLSGPRALEILSAIWKPAGHSELKARRLVLGEGIDPERGITLDRAMAVVFPAPHSFTGEDVAELHCHGGPLLVRKIISVAMAHGARFAEPGEYGLAAGELEEVAGGSPAENAAASRRVLEGGDGPRRQGEPDRGAARPGRRTARPEG